MRRIVTNCREFRPILGNFDGKFGVFFGQGSGAPLATPDLAISYESYPDAATPARPSLPRPAGASVDIMNADDNWTKGGGRWTQH